MRNSGLEENILVSGMGGCADVCGMGRRSDLGILERTGNLVAFLYPLCAVRLQPACSVCQAAHGHPGREELVEGASPGGKPPEKQGASL